MAAEDIKQLSTKQLQRAHEIFYLAMAYNDQDPDVVLGVLTTANAESTYAIIANNGLYAGEKKEEVWGWYGGQSLYKSHMRRSLLYPYDSVAGDAETTKDSLSLFQQREMYGYAGMGNSPHPEAVARLMDPAWSVKVFIAGVPDKPTTVRHWLDKRCPADLKKHDDLSVAKRCQWVQGSEFPTGGNYVEAMPVAHQLIELFGGLPNPSTSEYISHLLHWSK